MLEVDSMSKIKRVLSNDYIKSLIFLVIVLGFIVTFWFGLRIGLKTEYPLLAVASGSMIPTLNVGDLIVVQGGIEIDDLVAEYNTGDVIVFHKPANPDELIVHRAVERESDGIVTKGDHNSGPDPWRVNDGNLVGKVVWTMPYLGHIPLFVHTPTGILIVVLLIVILILLEFVIPSTQRQAREAQTELEDSNTKLHARCETLIDNIIEKWSPSRATFIRFYIFSCATV